MQLPRATLPRISKRQPSRLIHELAKLIDHFVGGLSLQKGSRDTVQCLFDTIVGEHRMFRQQISYGLQDRRDLLWPAGPSPRHAVPPHGVRTDTLIRQGRVGRLLAAVDVCPDGLTQRAHRVLVLT
jgi:hypothetical protein